MKSELFFLDEVSQDVSSSPGPAWGEDISGSPAGAAQTFLPSLTNTRQKIQLLIRSKAVVLGVTPLHPSFHHVRFPCRLRPADAAKLPTLTCIDQSHTRRTCSGEQRSLTKRTDQRTGRFYILALCNFVWREVKVRTMAALTAGVCCSPTEEERRSVCICVSVIPFSDFRLVRYRLRRTKLLLKSRRFKQSNGEF